MRKQNVCVKAEIEEYVVFQRPKEQLDFTKVLTRDRQNIVYTYTSIEAYTCISLLQSRLFNYVYIRADDLSVYLC